MAFHDRVQRLLLIGSDLRPPPAPPRAEPPAEIAALQAVVRSEHQALNAEALAAGQRYRSAFWALYLLAALAVLFAVLPVALGWSAAEHPLHRWALVWGLAELAVIAGVWLLYRRGVKENWKEQWLRARSQAERVWYLPLAAALRDPEAPAVEGGWYAELFGEPGDDVAALCARLEPTAREALAGAWQRPTFRAAFGRWASALLAGQRHYHQRTGRHHALLQRRVQRLSGLLFGLTALAAALHLVWHADVLLIATTAFPAFGAALHGALTQAESHRLQESAARLDAQLGALMDEIEQALVDADDAASAAALHRAAYAALHLILDEHQRWHHLVRPQHLPLG